MKETLAWEMWQEGGVTDWERRRAGLG